MSFLQQPSTKPLADVTVEPFLASSASELSKIMVKQCCQYNIYYKLNITQNSSI